MVDLSAQILPGSGFASVHPVAINDAGQIVGDGILPNGDVHAVVLEPDGPCNSNCEATFSASGNGAALAHELFSTSQPAVREKTATTALERIRNQIRRQLHIRRFGSAKQ